MAFQSMQRTTRSSPQKEVRLKGVGITSGFQSWQLLAFAKYVLIRQQAHNMLQPFKVCGIWGSFAAVQSTVEVVHVEDARTTAAGQRQFPKQQQTLLSAKFAANLV
jgi:hypothetical protein